MALSADALVTWLGTKARLDLDDAQQATVETLIDVASVRANAHTRRSLAARDDTVHVDGTGTDTLPLPSYPINSVDSVFVDQYRDFGADSEITDYLVDVDSLWRWCKWRKGTKNIKVVGNFGYATTPNDLMESIYQLVNYWLESPNVGWLETGSAEAGGYQTRYVGVLDVPFQIRNVWDAYRRVPV